MLHANKQSTPVTLEYRRENVLRMWSACMPVTDVAPPTGGRQTRVYVLSRICSSKPLALFASQNVPHTLFRVLSYVADKFLKHYECQEGERKREKKSFKLISNCFVP